LRGIIFSTPTQRSTNGRKVLRFVNILVEDCQFRWNNWGGLGLELSRNVTARRNGANHNGGAGIVTYKTRTLLFEDNETSYNNWRGMKGGFTAGRWPE